MSFASAWTLHRDWLARFNRSARRRALWADQAIRDIYPEGST